MHALTASTCRTMPCRGISCTRRLSDRRTVEASRCINDSRFRIAVLGLVPCWILASELLVKLNSLEKGFKLCSDPNI